MSTGSNARVGGGAVARRLARWRTISLGATERTQLAPFCVKAEAWVSGSSGMAAVGEASLSLVVIGSDALNLARMDARGPSGLRYALAVETLFWR